MTTRRARKTGFVVYGKYSNFVEYEYRGETYEVEYATCIHYLCTAPRVQHQVAQDRIDDLLERRSREPQEIPYEDTVEYAIEMFLNYCDGTEEE